MKRHIARMSNTDQRVVVVFMQIPGREDHALVVPTDNLPPRWEQHLMTVVESPEGQGDPDLGNVLGRRMMPDTTETVLQAFHNAGLLIPVHVDRVVMFPEPNRPYALRQILQAMNRLVPDEYGVVDKLNETAPAPAPAPKAAPKPLAADPYAAPERFNPHTTNQEATVNEGNYGIAHNLLIEADLLETEAKAKREKAYGFVPSLRPAVKKSMTRAQPVAEAAPAAPAPKAKRTAPTRKKAQG